LRHRSKGDAVKPALPARVASIAFLDQFRASLPCFWRTTAYLSVDKILWFGASALLPLPALTG
jgi:hypothetical protein